MKGLARMARGGSQPVLMQDRPKSTPIQASQVSLPASPRSIVWFRVSVPADGLGLIVVAEFRNTMLVMILLFAKCMV